MSKPDDIPQDIWDTVDNMPICGDGFPDDSDYEVIARAILAERERWSKVVEELTDQIDTLRNIDLPCCAHEFYMYGYDHAKKGDDSALQFVPRPEPHTPPLTVTHRPERA
jgi:hypothetical protein